MRRGSHNNNRNPGDTAVVAAAAVAPANRAVEQNMLNMGHGIVPDQKDGAKKRQKQGRCPTCGTATHKVGMLGKKTPLTVEGTVLKGRCLQCYPLEGYTTASARRPAAVPIATPSNNSSSTPVTGASNSPRGKKAQQQMQQRYQASGVPQQYPPASQQLYPQEAAPSHPSSPPSHTPSFPYRHPDAPPSIMRQDPADLYMASHHHYHQTSYPQHYMPHTMQQMPPFQPNGYPPAAAVAPGYHHYPSHDLNNVMMHSEEPSSSAVPRTLDVDDMSVVSQITLDVRLIDEHEVPPTAMRRPGPEPADGRPGRQSHSNNNNSFVRLNSSSSGNNHQRRNQLVIQEEEEYYEMPAATPLGLDPTAAGMLGAGSWDKEADIDAMLRGDRGGGGGDSGGGGNNFSSRSSKSNNHNNNNNSFGEIVFQPHDIVMDTPLVAAEAPSPVIANRYPPQLFHESLKDPPQRTLDEDGPSMMEDAPQSSRLDPPMLRQTPYSSGGKYYKESSTTNSSAPPLRNWDARGRADSGRILDPNGDLEPNKDDDDDVAEVEIPFGNKSKRSSSKRRSKKREARGMAARAAERAIDPTHSEGQDTPNTPPEGEIEDTTPASPKTPKKKKQGKTKKSEKKKQKQQKQDIHDIPAIMHCLSLDECDANMREKALDSLATILWRSSDKGREFILNNKGVETLNAAMWADMESPQVQSAALHLILAMAASSDGLSEHDMLSREESICDSVLFTMQNHARVPEIQLRGCLIFAALAGSSSDNNTISDGSLSNALQMVLNAMDNHPNDVSIQRAGLQALYHQCLASIHAEGNKRTLMESKLDSGAVGLDVVLRAMQVLQDDYVAVEWACRISWSLTSSEDLVKSSAGIPLPQTIVPVCLQHVANPAAAGLVEAALGAVGNLAHLERMHKPLVDVGAIGMIVESLQLYPHDFGISFEAVAAIANLSSTSHARESLVKSGAVPLTVASLDHFLDIHVYAEEGLRALVCLLVGSSDAKSILISTDVVKTIADASERHETLSVQQLCCSLVATLSVDPAACDLLVGRGAVGLVLNALESFSEIQVQEAGCAALRNMFHHTQLTDKLLEGGDTEKLIVGAMSKHKTSLLIQTNACCFLWNMIYKSKDSSKVVTSEGVKCIVKAMQSHMESGELVEQACGALWTIIHDSMDRKKDVVGNGAIDAVTCAIVMHPGNPEALEKACGVLSDVSSEAPLAAAIANAQGVTIVAEALRSNPNHLGLLEVGCLTLRNVVSVLSEVASEASAVIATVVHAMDDNFDSVGFQKEACNLLWILGSEDDSCQSKILALDGLSVLMKCLEENRDDTELQQSALGAFNKLSFSSNEESN